MRRFCGVLLLCIGLGCTGKPVQYKQVFFRMDTVSEVTVLLEKNQKPAPIWHAIDSLMLDWQERFSVTGKKSEVAVLNNRPLQEMPVSPSMAKLIALALRYGDSLDAGFDLTILPVKEVWGFGENAPDSMPLPDSAHVQAALKRVSYKNVSLNAAGDSVIFHSPDTRIDVGGIAKGCVLAEIAGMLDRRGVRQYLVVAGGDIVARGKRPDGNPWLIGVQHPRNPDEYLATLPLKSGASVVTSGDYERFRIVDGKRYHHIFNSHTGQTCLENQSVTIYAPDPVVADVLSTGLFCRPAKEIIAYVDKRPQLECLVVDSTGAVYVSQNWNGRLVTGNK